jgi:hypothetical protein
MRQRKSKVPEPVREAFFSRIKEFAGAIHSHGVENLYLDLRSGAYITESYPLETFKTDFKRMKNGGNGLLNEPALLGGILEILHFPAGALFGGPSASAEDNREVFKKNLSDALQGMDKQKKIPKKRIYSPRIIDRAGIVHQIIEDIFHPSLGRQTLAAPFFKLFAYYSSWDKAWDHERETRIKTILEKILNGPAGNAYRDYYWSGMSYPQNFPSIGPYDAYWNLCLVISYQLSCIESLYSIFQKSKMIKKKTTSGQPVVIDSLKTTQNVSLENEGQDVFAVELRNFCKAFDNIINNPDENIIYKLKAPSLPELEIERSYNDIISNFQKILYAMFSPTFIQTVQKSSFENSPVDAFLKPENVYINYYELKITDKKIGLLRENTRILTNQNVLPIDQAGQNTTNNKPILSVNDALNKARYERDEQDDIIDADILSIPYNPRENAENLKRKKSKVLLGSIKHQPSYNKNKVLITHIERPPPSKIIAEDQSAATDEGKDDSSNNSAPIQGKENHAETFIAQEDKHQGR